MANILIIDDDEQLCKMLSHHFDYQGHTTSYALSLKDGGRQLARSMFAIVFLDVELPDGNGMSLMPQIRDMASRPEIIILTLAVNLEIARMAIENGAWDYIEKPLAISSIQPVFESATTYHYQKDYSKSSRTLARGKIIGSSAQMEDCLDLASHAAKSDVSVLISGETGTGKELLAHIIHENSSRAGQQLVIVDCASLPENLAESVLFGHKKGAFSGADSDRDGLVKQAHGGTLFLDEIGELPLVLQKTFLRVLQEKKFRPVGGKSEIISDFRLISATNRHLSEMVGEGQFRDDLLFRIQSLVIKPPPLREHKQDITELTLYHITHQCKFKQREHIKVSPEFLESLLFYSWPGNVRELFNVLNGCLAKAGANNFLFPQHLPVQIRVEAAQAMIRHRQPLTQTSDYEPSSPNSLPQLKIHRKVAAREAEKDYLKNLINMRQVNIDEACVISGLSRSRFYELLKKYRLPAPKVA